ncbi:MAG: adenosylcobalamin-dependent ribonucleoside-diphosphate reductase, partial [Acidobacteria bacterium]|nr:adenosylcobalamin-dependent ribonucleoside-diphosphate reductase [Acidobacteriota bacterium]
PDIEEFINVKRDGISLRNFNISVGATEEFMAAVEAGSEFALRHPSTGVVVRHLSARKLFDAICDAAWATGDPGLIFLDTMARTNPLPACGPVECTNPCGELPLLPYESCNLGSINLVHFVRESNDAFIIDWARLGKQVREGVRFLDNVISANRFPLEAVAQATLANRKIGLGIMGFAELCILLGVSYASGQAIVLAEELMAFIQQQARLASIQLAEERGVFPNWGVSTFASSGPRLRNATQTSIAPTGTISIIAGTSSSIEPLFALAYRRQHVLGEQTLPELNPLVRGHLQRLGLDTTTLLESIASTGRLPDPSQANDKLRKLFVTELEITPEQHVRVQAAFQKYVDNAVSKTVNLPSEASPQQVADAYLLAHELGCKGVTIFRYGSRSEQTLQLGVGETPEEREYFTKCDPSACRL